MRKLIGRVRNGRICVGVKWEEEVIWYTIDMWLQLTR
jgi:hypothetical protein